MIPRFLIEEKEGKGTFSKCLCCYDYCFYDPPVLLQRCDAEPQYFFFFLRTITRLNTGCVTGQHTALVTFPPTQVELNTVEAIMLLFYEQFSRSALVSRTCVSHKSSAFTRGIRKTENPTHIHGKIKTLWTGNEMFGQYARGGLRAVFVWARHLLIGICTSKVRAQQSEI